MDEKLWAGIELKLQNAEFHLQQMEQSLQPPERTATHIAQEAFGMTINTGWQRPFYAHLDAFLSAARSVPEIIQCCFGEDAANTVMKNWLNSLPTEEREHRRKFKEKFEIYYKKFRELPLSKARNISEHRIGYAPVTVTISGLFGVIDTGDPVNRVPISQTPQIDDPNFQGLVKSLSGQPNWNDFKIGGPEGQNLFPACQEYLNGARVLMKKARCISDQVHGANRLTAPPTNL